MRVKLKKCVAHQDLKKAQTEPERCTSVLCDYLICIEPSNNIGVEEHFSSAEAYESFPLKVKSTCNYM